jgi:hypothetical protein
MASRDRRPVEGHPRSPGADPHINPGLSLDALDRVAQSVYGCSYTALSSSARSCRHSPAAGSWTAGCMPPPACAPLTCQRRPLNCGQLPPPAVLPAGERMIVGARCSADQELGLSQAGSNEDDIRRHQRGYHQGQPLPDEEAPAPRSGAGGRGGAGADEVAEVKRQEGSSARLA